MKIDKPGFYRTKNGLRAEVTSIRNSKAIGWVEQGSVTHPSVWKIEEGQVWNGRWGDDLVAEWRAPVSRTLNLYLIDRDHGLVILDESMTALVPKHVIAHKRVTITEGEGIS